MFLRHRAPLSGESRHVSIRSVLALPCSSSSSAINICTQRPLGNGWRDWISNDWEVIYSLFSVLLMNRGLLFFLWCFLHQCFQMTKLAAGGRMCISEGHIRVPSQEDIHRLNSLREFRIMSNVRIV